MLTTRSSSAQGSLTAVAAPHEALVWPAWGIALLGVLCVLIGLTYFAVRLRRARSRRDDV